MTAAAQGAERAAAQSAEWAEAQLRARVAALWPAAQAVAARRCRNTLYRLARGEGGFYDADDFWQDLFIEFWALAQRPELAAAVAAGATLAEEPLRTAWSKALWGGGLRILRRAPQRLWRRFEVAVPPVLLDGGDDAEEDDRVASHLRGAAEQLLAEDGAQVAAALARSEALERALSSLRPVQRQLLYMTAVQGVPARAVAVRLGLDSANAVAQRLRAARRQLAAQGGPADG